MKVVARRQYGSPSVLESREVPRPEPGEGEVLLRVRAASVNPADWHFLRGEPYVMRAQMGLRRPRGEVLGADMAGVVDAVGRGTGRLEEGEEVYGEVEGGGGFGEYAAVSEHPQPRAGPLARRR